MALYIVPVPVGNLQDITLRAIDTLKTVDFIIAEDTRHSLKLLNHLGIKKRLLSYYRPREQEKAQQIVKLLQEGNSAALISDSGTPCISDPGTILVGQMIEQGIEIIPLPGPTAFVPALVCSGIDAGEFLFLGFPPRKNSHLNSYLKNLKTLPYTLIFYESPRRVADFLKTSATIFGSRSFALVRELSKIHETIIHGNLSNLNESLQSQILMGEMVVVIEGCEPGTRKEEAPKLETLQDLYEYFKEKHNISKNQLKKILMKR